MGISIFLVCAHLCIGFVCASIVVHEWPSSSPMRARFKVASAVVGWPVYLLGFAIVGLLWFVIVASSDLASAMKRQVQHGQ